MYANELQSELDSDNSPFYFWREKDKDGVLRQHLQKLLNTPKPLEAEAILYNLCWYDPLHPIADGMADEYKKPPRQDCSCDNCHLGRDRLAVEILRLKAKCNENL